MPDEVEYIELRRRNPEEVAHYAALRITELQAQVADRDNTIRRLAAQLNEIRRVLDHPDAS